MSIQNLKEALRAQDTAALIISEDNIRYFTGFTSSNGVLFVTKDRASFFTDGRYIEAAQKAIQSCDEVLLLKTFSESVLPVIQSSGVTSVSFEASRLNYARAMHLQKLLTPLALDAEKLDPIIKEIRKVKTQAEANCMIRAQRIAEKALEILKPKIQIGAVERELALDLDYTMLRLGAQALSFETIFISGKETSMPHGVPTDKKIERGDFVTIDFGAVYQNYHSDMTRTFAVGEASDKMREVYATVLAAQSAGIEAVKPGTPCKEVDETARKVIADAGYGDYFTHSLGHGVGVEIHEYPTLSPKSDETLAVGHVVTVEPGIYIPNVFGVRIEDMGIVTTSGYQNFTKAPKALEIL